MICGLRGGSGKTLVSLGLSAAFRRRGIAVAPFKKGPDYIDAAWHALVAAAPCRNLDTFMMGPEQVLRSFLDNGRSGSIALIEGNRGLFDGMDAAGAHSSAELAKLLTSPVALVVDCTKATRTIAASVLGCKALDPALDLAGVVLNFVAGPRHEGVLRQAIEEYTGVPVLGALPRMRNPLIGERHLGLFTPAEHDVPDEAVESARRAVEQYLDVEALKAIADAAAPLPAVAAPVSVPAFSGARPRIGVVRDSAFTFYYPESLEQLRLCGAEIVEVNALYDKGLPRLDGLYIGGGFPETHAARLAANEGFRHAVRQAIARDLPVYAECGGLLYLSEAIECGGKRHPMAGVFPVTFEIASKPQGHGYAIMEVDRPNPFFREGSVIRGHEFRYARVLECDADRLESAYCVKRGKGFDGVRDGLCRRNALAAFCHVHPLGLPGWASSFVESALAYRRSVVPEASAPPDLYSIEDDFAAAPGCAPCAHGAAAV